MNKTEALDQIVAMHVAVERSADDSEFATLTIGEPASVKTDDGSYAAAVVGLIVIVWLSSLTVIVAAMLIKHF